MDKSELIALIKEAKRVDERLRIIDEVVVENKVNQWINSGLPFILKNCIVCDLKAFSTSLEFTSETQQDMAIVMLRDKFNELDLTPYRVYKGVRSHCVEIYVKLGE